MNTAQFRRQTRPSDIWWNPHLGTGYLGLNIGGNRELPLVWRHAMSPTAASANGAMPWRRRGNEYWPTG